MMISFVSEDLQQFRRYKCGIFCLIRLMNRLAIFGHQVTTFSIFKTLYTFVTITFVFRYFISYFQKNNLTTIKITVVQCVNFTHLVFQYCNNA